jgi:hypothetical protein
VDDDCSDELKGVETLEREQNWRGHWKAAKFTPMLNGAAKEEIQKLFETSQPPELGPAPRAGVKSEAELNKWLDNLLGNSNTQAEGSQLIRALALLWHDHLDAAHVIAQDIGNATGAFVHGIMHRREPDYGNAAYWFRRVGKHPAFTEIAVRARKILVSKGETDLASQLIPGGGWDPFAFITACENAVRSSSEQEKQILRELQALESVALFDWLCAMAEVKSAKTPQSPTWGGTDLNEVRLL